MARSKLKARARKLMSTYIEEELALQVAYFERKDAELLDPECTLEVAMRGPAPEERVKTLKNLLRDLKIAEQQEESREHR